MAAFYLVHVVYFVGVLTIATSIPPRREDAIARLERKVEFLLEAREKDHVEIRELKAFIQQNNIGSSAVKRFDNRQAVMGTGVGFTACVSTEDLHQLGSGQTIVFDRVMTNEGGAYRNTIGIFTAPVNGLYGFHTSVMTRGGGHMFFNIVKDGVDLDSIYNDASGERGFESTSEMWVLKLTQGNQVWIRSGQTGEIHGHCHSRFSGFLIAETEM